MNVRREEIYGLIGPNGAGKTTIFNLLTGVYEPTSGEIYFEGRRIDGLRSYEISRRGVSPHVPKHPAVPQHVGAGKCYDRLPQACPANLMDAVLRLPRFERDELEHREFAIELLEIFDLARYKDEGGTSLPYGNQRRLEIVRALDTGPLCFCLTNPPPG